MIPVHLRLAGLSLDTLTPGRSDPVFASNLQIRCCVFLDNISFRFVGVETNTPPLYGFLVSESGIENTFAEFGVVIPFLKLPLLINVDTSSNVFPPPFLD